MTREYPHHPMIGVGVVIAGPEGVLLIKRLQPPGVGKWSLPGGAQETGETVFQCAIREVQEETGLSIKVLGLVDVVDSIIEDDQGRVQYHYTLVDVAASVLSGTLRAADDAGEAGWFKLDQLDQLNLWSETERIIKQAIETYS